MIVISIFVVKVSNMVIGSYITKHSRRSVDNVIVVVTLVVFHHFIIVNVFILLVYGRRLLRVVFSNFLRQMVEVVFRNSRCSFLLLTLPLLLLVRLVL